MIYVRKPLMILYDIPCFGCDVSCEMFVLQVNKDLIFVRDNCLLYVQCVLVKKGQDDVCH